jgi:octaprenyl-diphosphate synthase
MLTPTPLEQLVVLLGNRLDHTDAIMQDSLKSASPLIPQLATYLMTAGGKRIRPLLTLAFATALGVDGDNPIKLAAAVEFIHTATLLHDDVVDEGEIRRGQQAPRRIWGNEASVLVGDFLFSRAFMLMVATGNLDVLNLLSTTSATIAEGEVLQLVAKGNIETTKEHYFNIIHAKTAVLFEAACVVSGMLACAHHDVLTALRVFGSNLGIAFQLSDDVLDYVPDTLDKEAGNDWRQRKITLPLLLMVETMPKDRQTFLMEHLGDAAVFHQVRDDMQKTGSLRHAAHQAEKAARTAADSITFLKDTPIKQTLLDVCHYVGTRALAVL